METIERIAVIAEFEQYLKDRAYTFKKEFPFNQLIPTDRKFRADYYLMGRRIIIEINGGQYAMKKADKNGRVYFSVGRHNKGGEGYENDLFKINLAQKYGFKIYQFTYEMLRKREYLNFI